MPFLVLYLGEGVKFDRGRVEHALLTSPHARSNPPTPGCLFAYDYRVGSEIVEVRLKNDGETIVIDGIGSAGLSAALEIQANYDLPIHLIDESYAFDLLVKNYVDVEALDRAIREAER